VSFRGSGLGLAGRCASQRISCHGLSG
jgi:hypothetical protein